MSILNPSFEADVLAAGAFRFPAAALHWTDDLSAGGSANTAIENNSDGSLAIPSATRATDGNNNIELQFGGGITQVLTGLTIGFTYILTFDCNFRASFVNGSLALFVDGSQVDSVTPTTVSPNWASKTLSFTATSTTHTIGLFHIGAPTNGVIMIDNITENTPTTTVLADDTAFKSGFPATTWSREGSSSTARLICNTQGYAELRFSGTSLTLNFDWSALTGISAILRQYPAVYIAIDGGAWVKHHSTSASQSVASGLASGNHTAKILAVIDAYTDRWTTAVGAVRIASASLDSGASILTTTFTRDKILYLGTSIGEAANTEGVSSSSTYVDNIDPTVSIPFILAESQNAIVLNRSFGGAGFTGGFSASNCPKFADTIGKYSNGKSALVSGKLPETIARVYIEMGANDALTSAGTIETELGAILPALRAMVDSGTPIIILQPFAQFSNVKTAITSSIATAADAHTTAKDLGAKGSEGITNTSSGAATETSFDGLHPNIAKSASLAAAINSDGTSSSVITRIKRISTSRGR